MNTKPIILAALTTLVVAFALPSESAAQSRRHGPSVHPVHVEPVHARPVQARPVHVVTTPAPRLDLRQDLAQTERTVERAVRAGARLRSNRIQTQIALAQDSLALAQRLLRHNGSVHEFHAALEDANEHARIAMRHIDRLVVVHHPPHRH